MEVMLCGYAFKLVDWVCWELLPFKSPGLRWFAPLMGPLCFILILNIAYADKGPFVAIFTNNNRSKMLTFYPLAKKGEKLMDHCSSMRSSVVLNAMVQPFCLVSLVPYG